MYITNPLRRAVAAAALATCAAVTVGTVAAARGASSPAPDTGASRADTDIAVVDRRELTEGGSYRAIAERQLPAGAAGNEVSALTDDLIAHNAAKSAASLAVQPAGDQPTAAPAAHEVVAGDSYWAIAESVLGAEATAVEVLAKTEALMALNSSRLGYDDPAMIHPGDVVYLEEARAQPVAQPAHAATTTEVATTTEKPTTPVIKAATLAPAPSSRAPDGSLPTTGGALPGMAVSGPVAPRSLAARAGDGAVSLTWLPPAKSVWTVDQYMIQHATSHYGPWANLGNTTGYSHTATGMTDGTLHYFRVAAYNTPNNEWGYSDIVTVAPATIAGVPDSPAPVPANVIAS
jgi:hypothetical protein